MAENMEAVNYCRGYDDGFLKGYQAALDDMRKNLSELGDKTFKQWYSQYNKEA